MEAPKDKATLQSFLGLVNYMKKFSQNLSRLAHPLRELIKQHTIFRWETHHDDAFNAVKKELSRTPTLQLFDPSKNHIIQTDASLKGLGAVLIQDERPVIYASRRRAIFKHRTRASWRGIWPRENAQHDLW